jgi:hypothetical protein
VVNLTSAGVLFSRLMRGIPEAHLRREYRRRLWRACRARPNPSVLLVYALKCAMHYHQHTMARRMASGRTPVYNSF